MRNFSRRSFRDRNPPLLHDAVCDECGKACQVPFRPSGDKPVYCSDCFEKKGGGDKGRSRDRRDSRRPSQVSPSDRAIAQLVEKIETLNNKLDIIISLLPSVGKEKPVAVKNKTEKTKEK